MKLYRAIEFSKLSFMLSAYGSNEWTKAAETFKNKKNKKNTNWWFDPKRASQIEYIIADVIANGKDSFFQSSMTFNSIVGGRFNPPNSFGIMYTASNPLLAALEVLFHIYNNKRKFLAHTAKNSHDFSLTFDEDSPKKAKNLIAVFTIDTGENIHLEDYTQSKLLEDTCAKIGFKRYTNHEDYDDDFIFGNNYEISRILGCFLHTHESNKAFKFKSARIDNSQVYGDFFNVIFPETYLNEDDLRLLPEYYLIETTLAVEDSDGMHTVNLSLKGRERIDAKIYLEKYLDEKKTRAHERLKNYRPNIPEHLSPSLNSRGVLFQRFRDGK